MKRAPLFIVLFGLAVLASACGGGGGGGGSSPLPHTNNAPQATTGAVVHVVIPNGARRNERAKTCIHFAKYGNNHHRSVHRKRRDAKPAANAALDHDRDKSELHDRIGRHELHDHGYRTGRDRRRVAIFELRRKRQSARSRTDRPDQHDARNDSNAIGLSRRRACENSACAEPDSPRAMTARHIPITFTVSAQDADGNTIIPPGSYPNPIALSITGDTNSALSLSTTSVPSPGPSSGASTVSLLYNSARTIAQATITATSGTVTASIPFAPIVFTPTSAPLQLGGSMQAITLSEAGYAGAFTLQGASRRWQPRRACPRTVRRQEPAAR